MAVYRYRAVTAADEVVEGEMEGGERAAVLRRIHEMGYYPLRVEAATTGGAAALLRREPARSGLGQKDLARLLGGLAILLRAGLPLERALESQQGGLRGGRARAALAGLLERLRKGSSLADAMAADPGRFPPYIVSMIRAGEAGGALEEVLARLGDFLDRMQALREKVRSAMIYPVILLGMAGLSLVLLMAVVVPEFRPLFEGAGQALPLPTRVVIGVSDALAQVWWLLAALAGGTWLGARAALRRPGGRLRAHALALRLPLAGDLLARIETARLARLLGTLLLNGVNLVAALHMSRAAVRNAALAEALDTVVERVRGGGSLAQSLAQTARFPDLFVDLVRVGEETGQIDAMLARAADVYDAEVEQALTRAVALLVPALTIGLGILIAGIIASILFAVLGINQLAF